MVLVKYPPKQLHLYLPPKGGQRWNQVGVFGDAIPDERTTSENLSSACPPAKFPQPKGHRGEPAWMNNMYELDCAGRGNLSLLMSGIRPYPLWPELFPWHKAVLPLPSHHHHSLPDLLKSAQLGQRIL